jgi:glycosyltransferase involved in cell wall biosynthesis
MPNPLRFAPLSSEEYKDCFGNRKNIIACGRIEPQKGYEKLIRAFSIVANQFPGWVVDIYGQGKPGSDYPKELEKLVEDLRLSERIHFKGYHNDLNNAMKEHSVFCLSSEFEGFPNVLSEAMASGCACVSFDIVTGPREIIVDGLDGLIVEDQNIDALAEGLRILMGDEKMRYDFGLHAIEDIKRFSKDKVVDKWEHMFSKLVSNYNKG